MLLHVETYLVHAGETTLHAKTAILSAKDAKLHTTDATLYATARLRAVQVFNAHNLTLYGNHLAVLCTCVCARVSRALLPWLLL